MVSIPTYFPTKESAKILNLSERTLEKMRVQGRGPVFRRFGRRVLYDLEDLKAWADACARRSTSE